MQEAVFAFQAFQVLRFGSLMLGAMSLAWLGAPKTLIDTFETLLLVGGATTFFWLGGLLDGFLLLQKNANPLHGDAIQRQTMFAVLALSITSAVATGVAAMIFLQLSAITLENSHTLLQRLSLNFAIGKSVFSQADSTHQLLKYSDCCSTIAFSDSHADRRCA